MKPPASVWIVELLFAGHDHVGAVELAAQPEPLEHQPDHPQVLGNRVLDDQLAAGDTGERHERADLDVIGRDRVRAAVQPVLAVNGHHVRADAVDLRAHRDEHPRQVLNVRLRRSVADHGRARRQRGRHQRVLGRHHRRLVHQEVAWLQPARRSRELDRRVDLDRRAERAHRVEVRVEAAAADHVAAGRRHRRAAEAREQRAGEQERGTDLLAELAVDDACG